MRASHRIHDGIPETKRISAEIQFYSPIRPPSPHAANVAVPNAGVIISYPLTRQFQGM